MKLRKYIVGEFYHWGDKDNGGGQLYQIVNVTKHFLFLRYGYDNHRPEVVQVISKKEAEANKFELRDTE